MHYKNGKIVKILCILGAAIAIIECILGMVGLAMGALAAQWGTGVDPLVLRVILGIIAIVLCVIVLASFDVLGIDLKVEPNWLVLLLFAILILLFGGLIGGILMLVGVIVGMMDAL